MTEPNKKKKKGSVWGWVILFYIIFSAIMEDLPDDIVAVVIVLGILLLVCAIAVVVVKRKRKAASIPPQERFAMPGSERYADKPRERAPRENVFSSQPQHNHDRLTNTGHKPESGFQHWKTQLDGFLEAGLIDKAEYKLMLERYRRSLQD